MFEGMNKPDTGIPQWHSDLAIERRRANVEVEGIKYQKEESGAFVWERISVSSAEGARSIGRPCGRYDTLTLARMDTLDEDAIDDAANEIAGELCRMIDGCGIFPDRLLVVGLGNASLTPDSVGPRAAELTHPTMHLKELDPRIFNSIECSEIAVLSPGVTARTGMDTSDITVGVVDRISPDAVIAIDALASGAPERLGTTIQISDTGIFPGSGTGNKRSPLNERTLGVPVIAIGVPTLIDARIFSHGVGVNQSNDSSLLVAPREIDEIAAVAARIIAGGINQAFGTV